MTLTERIQLALNILKRGDEAAIEFVESLQPPSPPIEHWFPDTKIMSVTRRPTPRELRQPPPLEIPLATWRHGQNWARWVEANQ